VPSRHFPFAVSHCDVHVVVAQVSSEHLRGQTKPQLRFEKPQRLKLGQHAEMRKSCGGGENQFLFLSPAREPVEGTRNALHRFRDHEVERLSLVRQFDGPVQPMKQANTQRLFQKLYLPAHGRLRDTKLIRGQRKAVQPRDGLEFDQSRQRRYEPPITFCAFSCCFHLLLAMWEKRVREAAMRALRAAGKSRALISEDKRAA
jgi:hypothetical protein